MPELILKAPGEDAAGPHAAYYRVGYEAGLRTGRGVTCPAGDRGVPPAVRATQAAAWATGYARGCADRERGCTFVTWQQTGERVRVFKQPVKRDRRRQRGLPACPGDTAYRRPVLRAAYRRGYLALRQGKGIGSCPYMLQAAASIDQLTAGLRAAWLAGHARAAADLVGEVKVALRAEAVRAGAPATHVEAVYGT